MIQRRYVLLFPANSIYHMNASECVSMCVLFCSVCVGASAGRGVVADSSAGAGPTPAGLPEDHL